MSTKKNPEKQVEKQPQNIEIHMNPSIQPIFSDQIFKIEVDSDSHIAKLFLGQIMDDKIFHNSTVVVPLKSLLKLRELISSEKFESEINTSE